jgi:hypothetical protein
MTLSLEEVAPNLARSSTVRRHAIEHFGEDKAKRVLAKMRAGNAEEPDGPDAHDWLYDQIRNEGDEVWGALFEGEWPISVVSYGGTFMIRAVDHEDIGYFTCKEDAIDHARGNWLGL